MKAASGDSVPDPDIKTAAIRRSLGAYDAGFGMATSLPTPTIEPDPVDVALVLAADCSGSVSNEDLTLQLRGYAEAITSAPVIRAVRSGRHGRIALTFVGWSDARRQDQLVPWAVIDGLPAARDFAVGLLNAPHPIPGYTSISGAIDYCAGLLSRLGCVPEQQVIDVSGDGVNTDGRAVTEARDAAVAAGIRINGLPIVRQNADIAAYYAENVIGGPAAFVVVAADITSFHAAVLRKLVVEIATELVAGVAG